MARDLKLHVVAEGVEEKAQLSFLSQQECERVQGFYFSRPLPPAEVLPVIKQLQGKGAN
jgi:EAL domain-containing protein (putative c-di-GMP-specific phosphodiesterase class I)